MEGLCFIISVISLNEPNTGKDDEVGELNHQISGEIIRIVTYKGYGSSLNYISVDSLICVNNHCLPPFYRREF
jgi:hypothetical protein